MASPEDGEGYNAVSACVLASDRHLVAFWNYTPAMQPCWVKSSVGHTCSKTHACITAGLTTLSTTRKQDWPTHVLTLHQCADTAAQTPQSTCKQ